MIIMQKQPNRWSCLPTAFAMCLDMPVNEFISKVGHDGSGIRFPDLKEPYNRQSFHMQEMIDACIKSRYWVTMIEKNLVSEEPFSGSKYKFPGGVNRFNDYVWKYKGVLIGPGHAVACEQGIIYNPNGETELLDIYKYNEFYIVSR